MERTADTYLHLPRRRYFTAVELHAVAIGSIAAAVLLVGHGFNVAFLKTIAPGFPEMRARTAAYLMALSLSCLLSLRPSRRSQIMSSAIAGGMVLHILWLLATNIDSPAFGIVGLIPIQGSAISIVLAGVALLIINLAPRYGLAAGIIALVVATAGLYRVIGLLLFGGAPADETSPFNSMGLHTALLLAWFMSVCVLMHPRLPFSNSVLQSSLRGRVLRRGLPFVLLVPVIASAVSLLLALSFGWATEMLFALSAAISVVLGALLIWWLSRLIEDWQREANEQSSRLSRANEALEQYASSAAHDLKAPARHVLLYGELLEEALQRDDIPAARKYARSIRDSAAEMPVTIEGLLDYSRSAYMRVQLGEHSLSELVQAAAAQNADDLGAAQAQVNVLREARLICDSTLITTVLHNLIGNAIKNRRRDRKPVIRIDAVREGEFWKISVEDNGVGFDPDFATVAFNPLARGVHTAGEGGGIGLATCRNIVQSHGGEIRVDPSWRNGARIEFTLPLQAKAEMRPAD